MRDPDPGGPPDPSYTPNPADPHAGDPKPPPGGKFTVKEQDLVNAADCWDRVSGHLLKARGICQEGWAQTTIFGITDALYTVGKLHGAFNEKVCYAANDGSVETSLVADGLVGTANYAAGTDSDVHNNFIDLKR
jgi:hypothetical protein